MAGHLRSFKEQVEAAQELNPTFVNSHSCKDYLTREMAEEFFVEAIAWAKAKGYVVHHESHRKRYLHSPWVTRDQTISIAQVTLSGEHVKTFGFCDEIKPQSLA